MKYIITGTSSGLGFSLAMKLLPFGNVIGISRSLGKAASLGDGFDFVEHDLSDSSNYLLYKALLERLQMFISDDAFSLVFNASSFYMNIKRLDGNSLTSLFEVNVFSAMNLVRDLQTSNLKRILFVNSVSGLVGQSLQPEYVASKHALMGFSRSLAQSARDSNFDVMSINPGGMKTELWNHHGEVDCSDFLDVNVVSDLCLSLLMIPQRAFIQEMVILPPSDVR